MMSQPSPLEIANRQQRDASNPGISTFVSASAGSGKTKLLTDRILRLLLTGTSPRKILCLTYTKAAAAEMAIRLHSRLGAWVVMPEAQLRGELAKLDVDVSAKAVAIARQLLADILDLPGGMRISTIHAFCQSVLKRFPLEAQLSPHFELEDENAVEVRLREARENIMGDQGRIDAIFTLAAETNEMDFAKIVSSFSKHDEIQALLDHLPLHGLQQLQQAALGLTGDADLQKTGMHAAYIADLTSCIGEIFEFGTPSGKKWAEICLGWLALSEVQRQEQHGLWRSQFFVLSGKRRETKGYFGKALSLKCDALAQTIDLECERLEQLAEAQTAARLANFNARLFELIRPINQSYKATKIENALLSYADLISATLSLLNSPDQVAWVLYKLDEGIDHLLLDEVQDTAPRQWQITDAIANEFFNGAGARDVERSIFAVGDEKQSIFSFQGSDLESFSHAKDRFRRLVQDARRDWHDGDLSVSFRSTEPVLSLVDAVFSGGAVCQGVCAPGMLAHVASRQGQAGQVSLWPITRSIDAAPVPDWDVASDYVSAKSAKEVLANQIASHIQRRIETLEIMPSRGRAVTAGDFLILVRHRDELVVEITRACKARNIAVAGLDRMVLTEQQAVSDLLALCDSLLLPADDLAFAQFLVSPLGGLTDESLMELALHRPGALSTALFARQKERQDWLEASAFFQILRRQVDFISPFSLLATALGNLGGRARLLQRLGADAAEPIDELLAEAQAYTQSHPASLQNFIVYLRQSGATIKREPEGSGDAVRIMTVHGAKGLQAPIVILPDTTGIPKTSNHLIWVKVPGTLQKVPVYCPHKDLRSSAVKAAMIDARRAQLDEYNRLLYVALTRAEDELIVCGAEGKQKAAQDCWYHAVRLGFAKLAAQFAADGTQSLAMPQTAEPDRLTSRREVFVAALPDWAGSAPHWQARPPAKETTQFEALAPSRSAEETQSGGRAASPLVNDSKASGRAAALTKGKLIHALLQHLPNLPARDRPDAMMNYLRQPGLQLPEMARGDIQSAVDALLSNETLRPLFCPGSRAEVPLAGVVGNVEIGGLVDRLIVLDRSVIVVDFKTDRAPAATAEDIPPAYLRQMAAYAAILRQIFPDKSVNCQLIWTETGTCTAIADEVLARHAPVPAQPFAETLDA